MRKWFESFDEDEVSFVGFGAAAMLSFSCFVVIWYLHLG
jgi:hypothetical protein